MPEFITEYLILLAVKRSIIETMKDLGISPDSYCTDSILSFQQIRNIAIREEFKKRKENKEKTNNIFQDLSDKNGLSLDTIHSIVSKRR